jgi:hypothetical protein
LFVVELSLKSEKTMAIFSAVFLFSSCTLCKSS